MTPKSNLRKKVLIELEKDIKALSPTQFELVCHDLLCCIEGQPLIHRGLTEREHPVGYSVDTFDTRGTVVGEYSAEKGYFQGNQLEKLASDIKHAQSKAREHQVLYLMSNQRCQQKTWTKVNNLISRNYPATESAMAHVFDSRELATKFYDQLAHKTDLVACFIDFLPALTGLRENFAFENALPPVTDDNIPRVRVLQDLKNLLAKHTIVGVTGISGSGKTYAAISYANQTLDKWEQIIWVDGDDLRSGTLESVSVARMGLTFNLQGRIKRNKTLLVIDRWTSGSSELHVLTSAISNNAHPETRVIVTSEQKLQDTPIVSAHDITQDEALSILSFGLTNKPPDIVVKRLFEIAGGLPLVAAILRETVAAGDISWEECLSVLSDVGKLERDDAQILERILTRSANTIERELLALAYIGTRTFEAHLLKHITSPIAVSKLKKRCLVHEAGNGSLTTHEIVLSLAKKLDPQEHRFAFESLFWKYFEKHVSSRPAHYIRSIHRHSTRLREKAERDASATLIARAYLDLEESIDSKIIDKLANTELASNSDWCSASCKVEAMELKWRRERGAAGKSIARRNAEILENALALVENPEAKSYLRHHAAKFNLFSDEFEGALELLQSCDEESLQTRLQKARCLRLLDRVDEAKRELSRGFDAIQENVSLATPVTAIAMYTELRYREFKDLRETYLLVDPTPFLENINAAIIEGNGQPYDAVATLTNTVAYDHPKFLQTIINNIETPEPSTQHYRQNKSVGRMILTFAKNKHYAGETEKANILAKQAQRYLDQVIGKRTCGSIGDRSRCLELQGLLKEAFSLLETEEERNPFDEHAMCRLELGMDLLSEASTRCKQLIEHTRGQAKLQHYLPTFLDLMGDIALALNTPIKALAHWREALDATTTSPRFREQLTEKIKRASPSNTLTSNQG